VKSWDVAIAGAGVIGLALAWRLKQAGFSVLLVEKGEPAGEASYAAGGMIAHCDPHLPTQLCPLANASAAIYPEFAQELHNESGHWPDLRDQGTIAFVTDDERSKCHQARYLTPEDLVSLEPSLEARDSACFLPEYSVDPRALSNALVKAAKHRGVDFVTGSAVTEIEVENGRAAGVKTAKSFYPAGVSVNCAGAWASQVLQGALPTYPVKGQMVSVVPAPEHTKEGPLLRHVVRTPEVYMIPRSDGRVLLGATVEDAGFDKRTDADTIQKLHHAAARVVPAIGEMRIHDAWAGLRPGTPDNLPILGQTSLPGYFAATGHYRDGIMLAPITAKLMTQLLTGAPLDFDLQPFSPLRFG